MKEKEIEKYNFIPRDFSEIEDKIQEINREFGIEIAIIKNVRKYILLNRLRKLAQQLKKDKAVEMVDELTKENVAVDLSSNKFIMLSKKHYEDLLKDKSIGITAMLDERMKKHEAD